jgi:hypothetical protein
VNNRKRWDCSLVAELLPAARSPGGQHRPGHSRGPEAVDCCRLVSALTNRTTSIMYSLQRCMQGRDPRQTFTEEDPTAHCRVGSQSVTLKRQNEVLCIFRMHDIRPARRLRAGTAPPARDD